MRVLAERIDQKDEYENDHDAKWRKALTRMGDKERLDFKLGGMRQKKESKWGEMSKK